MIGFALLTDILDGFLARVLKQTTDWGRLFDPLADKIWIAGLGIFLALPWRANPLPLSFLILVLFRDVAIVLGGIHAYRRHHVVLEANFLGKMSMFMTALTLLCYTINFDSPDRFRWVQPQTVLWISVVFLVASGVSYFIRYKAFVFSQAAQANSSSHPTNP
jgi:CDP-diacylglycerol--glycerol-3-phosphate 3-phosphatidyltransferase